MIESEKLHRYNDLAPRMARELVRLGDLLDDQEDDKLWDAVDPKGTTRAIIDDLLEIGASGEPVDVPSVDRVKASHMVVDVLHICEKILADSNRAPRIVSVQDLNALMQAVRDVKQVIAQGGGYKLFADVLRREK